MKTPSALNLLDTASLFAVTEWVKDISQEPTTLSYGELLAVLESERRLAGFRPADGTFGAAAIDPLSENQKRFLAALGHMGIDVEAVDYRHAYVSLPRPTSDRQERSVSTLAPQFAYVLGLLAGRNKAEALVVTGNFDLYVPLLDFAKRRGGRAGIVFFRRFLDPRWSQVGLLESDSPFAWIDLEPYSERLLGTDLPDATSQQLPGTGGLGKI